jgi:hypothetical protein
LATFLYMVGQSLYSLYSDWRLGKDIESLRAESEAKREAKRLENERRLNNGCQHAFGEGFGGFPPNACPKCGLEKERPAGGCDHVWRRSHEAIPSSCCEKCGKKYQDSALV